MEPTAWLGHHGALHPGMDSAYPAYSVGRLLLFHVLDATFLMCQFLSCKQHVAKLNS